MPLPSASESASRAPQERRRAPRKGALWVGSIETPNGTFDCRVLNLSPSGAKVELTALVAKGQTVTLHLAPLGEFRGTVVWRRDRCIGVSIDEHRMTTTRSRMVMPGGLRIP